MTNQKISTKKLKAIVFTDIVGFTKISAEDEQHALDIIDKQRELLKPIVLEHKGEWLKEIGDGLLFSFDSSLDAVNCSIKIQEVLKDSDDFKLRIGIHQGDIFIKDGDVYGDDVNIASRVESFSPEGGIAISDKISKDISGVNDIKTSFIGYRKLKGVEQETQIKSISSHNLPSNTGVSLPVLAAYICFFFASLSFLRFFLEPLIIVDEAFEYDKSLSIKEILYAFYTNIRWGIKGITYLFIGYSSLSYSRGVSLYAQRLLTYLAYIYVLYPLRIIFSSTWLHEFRNIFDSTNEAVEIIAFLFLLCVLPITLFQFYKSITKKSANRNYWIAVNIVLIISFFYITGIM